MPHENLTMCFSGGGFRAMLFHLGVVRALRDVELLQDIKHIFSVSGGSILAAHLVLNWERYTADEEDKFRACARELVDFAQGDLRGRILRRWLLSGGLCGRTKQLARHYDALYRGARLDGLSAENRPALHILATNMVSGEAWYFEHCGIVRIADNRLLSPIPAASQPVADAVTASSAFPPMFPPLRINAKQLASAQAGAPGVLRLTDGGVFDNTGVRAAFCVVPNQSLLISDASATFDQATDHAFRSVVARTVRTTNILMGRVARLEEQRLAQDRPTTGAHRLVTGHIADFVEPSDVARVNASPSLQLQSRAIQEWIKNVKTDLDFFADDVICAIYRHGYEVGLRMACNLRPADQFSITEAFWNPCSRPTEQGRQRPIGARILGKPQRAAASAPDLIETKMLETLKRSANRSPGLWNAHDGLCWAIVVALFVAACVAIKWMYWDPRHPAELIGQRWQVFDIGGADDVEFKRKIQETGLASLARKLTNEAYAVRVPYKVKKRVVQMVAHSRKLSRRTARLHLCSSVPDSAYKTFAVAALFVEVAGVTYARIIPVERTDTNAFRLDVPDAPKGSILALIVSGVGLNLVAHPDRLAASLTEWRKCDDVGN